MKVGIAFSGGGLRGAYQVGCYKAFLDCGINVNGFVGTSIGSFNAAMCASNRFYELYNFWYNESTGSILGFSDKLINKANSNEYDMKLLMEILENVKNIVVNKGISTINIRKKLEEFNISKYLYKSKKDFGLVTVRANDFKPRYMFKEDIPANKLNDYIIASCFLPIFKFEKLIDDNYYLDGGFHDYIPANSLLEKGYDKVYVIDLEAIGIRRPYKYKEKIIRNCTIEVFLSFYNNVYNLPVHKQVLSEYLPKQLIAHPTARLLKGRSCKEIDLFLQSCFHVIIETTDCKKTR